MTEKTVNYTDAMVARLGDVYDSEGTDVERKAQVTALAVELGKSEPSIRAKLTREGLYTPLTKVPTGKAGPRKAELVQTIADKLDVDVDVIGSLEKATKNVLIRLIDAL